MANDPWPPTTSPWLAVGLATFRRTGRSGGPSCSTGNKLPAPSPADCPRPQAFRLIPSPVGPTRAFRTRPDGRTHLGRKPPQVTGQSSAPPTPKSPRDSGPPQDRVVRRSESREARSQVVLTAITVTCDSVVRTLKKFGHPEPIFTSNVKEHATLSAGASVERGVEVKTMEDHVIRAAGRGCCVSSC